MNETHEAMMATAGQSVESSPSHSSQVHMAVFSYKGMIFKNVDSFK
jgi:hypothetical protein